MQTKTKVGGQYFENECSVYGYRLITNGENIDNENSQGRGD